MYGFGHGLVCLVCLVCLVWLVCLVCMVWLVCVVFLDRRQPDPGIPRFLSAVLIQGLAGRSGPLALLG